MEKDGRFKKELKTMREDEHTGAGVENQPGRPSASFPAEGGVEIKAFGNDFFPQVSE